MTKPEAMTAKEYVDKEYDSEHLMSIIEMNDDISILGLMDEFAKSKLTSIKAEIEDILKQDVKLIDARLIELLKEF